MRWMPVLVLLMVVAGCAEEQPRSAASSPALGRSDEHRFAYELPAGWERASQSLTPNLRNPVEIVAAGTARGMRAQGGDCAHVPVGGIEAMGPRDVFVTVQERYGEPRFPLRPARFSLPDDEELTDATLCARNGKSLEIHWFGFRDAGRGFHVLVALGDDAPPERRAEALAFLDSLRFEPGPGGVHLDPGRAVPFQDADAMLSWVMPLPPWRHYDWPLTSVREPVERLMLGTFELERGPPGDDCVPRAAIDALPPDGAFIYVFEYTDGRGTGFPQRWGELEFGPERNYECIGSSRMARWREGGRAFQAHVVLGPRAAEALEREARSIVNSIRVR